MNCPKTLELLWMIDGKLSKIQEQNFQNHFQECSLCKERYEDAKKFFAGQTGLIIQGDDTSCPSDGSLVRTLQMEATFEESRSTEDHMQKCKKCFKRYVDFYTGKLDAQEVLRKEEVALKKAMLEADPSSVYGNKMDQVAWWKGGAFFFLGLKFSKTSLALFGGALVALFMVTLLFLNEYLSASHSVQGPVVPSSHHSQEDSNRDSTASATGKDKKESFFSSLYLVNGKAQQVHKNKLLNLRAGILNVEKNDRVLVSENQEALFAKDGFLLRLIGPAQFHFYIENGNFHFYIQQGIGFVESFSPNRNILFHLVRNKKKAETFQFQQAQFLFANTQKEQALIPLDKGLFLLEGLEKKGLKAGYIYSYGKKGRWIQKLLMAPPDWFFQFYGSLVPIFHKLNSFHPIGKSGEIEFLDFQTEKYVQFRSSLPQGILAESEVFPLQVFKTYLIEFEYRLFQSPSRPTISLIGKSVGDISYYQPFRLEPNDIWSTSKHIIMIPSQWKGMEYGKLRVSFLGKGRLDLKRIRISQFSRDRNYLKIIDLENTQSLEAFQILQGVWLIQDSHLIGKATYKPSILNIPFLNLPFYQFYFTTLLPAPFGIRIGSKKKNLYYEIYLDLYENKAKLMSLQKGIVKKILEKKLEKGISSKTQWHLLKNGNFILLEKGSDHVLEFQIEPEISKDATLDLYLVPETKQIFKNLQFYGD